MPERDGKAGWRPGTRVVHAGLPPAAPGTPFLPGPVLAAPFHLSGDPGDAAYAYGRQGNPTWTGYERALGELEDGEAVLFGSGAAAVSAVVLPALRPGDVLVAPVDGYPAVRWVAREHLAPRSVEVRLVPSAQDAYEEAIAGARLVWLETPSNPALEVCDIAALAARAHQEGALLAVDNTLATPLLQRPLELGADFSVSSASKHLTGHSDLVLGYAATADDERADALREWRTHTGAIAGPFETWLAHRSLATLDVRLDRACANAARLAEWLAARSGVHGVRFPGLADDPAHAVAARQMSRFGTVVGLTLADRSCAERFLTAAELIADATSFGGAHTSAERRARWGDDVAEGFIRLSVGCEDVEDLIADVDQALTAAGVPGATGEAALTRGA